MSKLFSFVLPLHSTEMILQLFIAWTTVFYRDLLQISVDPLTESLLFKTTFCFHLPCLFNEEEL